MLDCYLEEPCEREDDQSYDISVQLMMFEDAEERANAAYLESI